MATSKAPIGWGDADIASSQISRQRMLADSLLRQSETPNQGQMIGNRYVAPNWTQQLATALSGGLGDYINKKADQDQLAFGQHLRDQREKDVGAFTSALNGTPGQDIQQPMDDAGNSVPNVTKPAVPGSISSAMALALKSQDPTLQGIGSSILGKQVDSDVSRQRLADLVKQFGGAGGAPGAGQPAGVGGVNPLVAALLASGDPGFAKLGGAITDVNKPIALREGDLVRPNASGQFESVYSQPKVDPGMQPLRGPDGQVTGAQAIPGYAAGAASIKGSAAQATEGAKASNDVVTIQTPNGPVMMTRAEIARQAAGYPLTPAAPQPGATSTLQGDQAAIRAQLNRIPDPQERAAAIAAYDAQPSTAPQPKKAPGVQLQSEGAGKFETTMGGIQAETLNASHKSAKAAADSLLGIEQSRKAIAGGAFQGSGAETKLAIAKFINANIPGVNIDPAKVSNTDYLQSTLGHGLLEEAKTLGSNPSNADAVRINTIVGEIGKDPGAMKKILDWRQSMAERAIQNHNTSVDQAVTNGFKPQFDMRVKQPERTQNTGGFRIIGVQ